MSDAPGPAATDDAPRRRRRPARRSTPPNYAARRMLASTIVITVLVALGVVIWQLVDGGGGSSIGDAAEWDEIALVDRTTGAITTVDGEGEIVAKAIGLGRVVDVVSHRDRAALIGPDQIVLTDAGADAEPATVPIDRGTTVTPVTTEETFHLVVGEPSGGNVLIVDALTGDTYDVAELTEQSDPLMFAETLEVSPAGDRFALADAARFRTILVTTDAADEPDPRYFPDQPIAVGDDLIATSQVIDREADVTLSDLDRNVEALVSVSIPAGGVIVDDALVMVATDGEMYRIAPGAEEAERLGVVAVPAGETVADVFATADGQRLVVSGQVFEAVVDVEGSTLFTTTFTSPVQVSRPEPTWTCAPIGGGESFHSVVELETGEQLADLTGFTVTGTSGDGCTVIGERDGITEVVTPEGAVRLGRLRDASLAPDGRLVVTTDTTGTTELVPIDDELELGEPIALDDAPANLDVAFLDR